MKRQWKAKLTYTIDSGHPDFACIHDWEEGKVYVYEDVYTCDVDVEREKIAAYARNDMRRGEDYYSENAVDVIELQDELIQYLFPEIIANRWFKVVSFDNLAIEQLKVQEQLPEKKWDRFYMGDDGDFTFYLDLVEGTFGRNSLATKRYPIMDNIDDMFRKILNEG